MRWTEAAVASVVVMENHSPRHRSTPAFVAIENMLTRYFPKCSIEGPIEPPVPFQHLGSRGAVPNKCGHCKMLFEGECNRNSHLNMGWAHLDYGPCGVSGPTDPVLYDDTFISAKVPVPKKCSTCMFLAVDQIRGLHCTKDRDKWGDFNRGLDWGDWTPSIPPVELPFPQRVDDHMRLLAVAGDMLGFVVEYRNQNPATITDARQAYMELRFKIQEATNNPMDRSGGSAAS